MGKLTKIESRIKKIVKQIAGKPFDDDREELLPEVAIRGTGDIYCFHPTTRTFKRICRGIKAYIIKEEENESGRLLIYTFGGDIVEIEEDELLFTGFD